MSFDSNPHSPVMIRILEVLERDSIFKKDNLSINELARAINSNRTYVGRAIGELGVNFPAFINNYRAQYAISLLIQKKFLNVPLGDIAEMSGFSTVRQMNIYVKRSTGTTSQAFRLRIFGP